MKREAFIYMCDFTCTELIKKSMRLSMMGRAPALKMANALLLETFSSILTAFSAISTNSKFCIFSQRTETPSALMRLSLKEGEISRMFSKAAAE